jgi:hypothetical protein
MPSLDIPADTFRRLAERAAALNVSVEDLVRPVLEQLARNGTSAARAVLTGEEWRREFDAWTREVEGRAGRYPPGFQVDDSRETIYREREGSQL